MPSFDPGYGAEPFRSLVERAPGADVYPPTDFRVEWGPIFHRGRLDGTARVLVIGQDPATQESIARRILVGAAGHRVQGFLAKCGIDRSYVMVNTYLFSVYGQWAGNRHRDDDRIAAYRHAWLDALTAPGRIEAVVAFGGLADHAWRVWLQTATGGAFASAFAGAYAHVTHPTQPDSASGGSSTRRRELVAAMLSQWNDALPVLRAALQHPDVDRPLAPYGTAFAPADLVEIPPDDLPAGLPDWMRGAAKWADRVGTGEAKRRSLAVTVPRTVVVGAPVVPAVPAAPLARPEGLVARPSLAARRYALAGRVVTMDDVSKVIPHGVVYVDGARIVAVRRRADPPPDGFADAPRVETRGTIYPGLIELHNHLPYGVLPLWKVDKQYANRDQWRGTKAYKALVTGPLGVLAARDELSSAVARYTECKCLVGGVTTTQGVKLAKQSSMPRFYHGVVRNAEYGADPALPSAGTHIADVAARDAADFRRALDGQRCVLLHLSEGTDAASRQHFLDLRVSEEDWALGRSLAGIHAVALQPEDFRRYGQSGAAMIWSPFSNYLLYGATADVRAARTNRVRIGLGSDWSFTGSKNLLGELKVARLVSAELGGVFDDRDLVAMATRDAADILGWEDALGTVEAGKLADLVVLGGTSKDPYAQLVEAKESDLHLVVIGGVARYGTRTLMERLTENALESLRVGAVARRLNLGDGASDELVAGLSLADAASLLRDALAELPQHARALAHRPAGARADDAAADGAWHLALDELALPETPHAEDTDETIDIDERPLRHAMSVARAVAPQIAPTTLDPLTVADDPQFFDTVAVEPNLPMFLRTGLAELYA
jgi:cytosine/adenosine deaminase-related metal-dependent hydrolase